MRRLAVPCAILLCLAGCGDDDDEEPVRSVTVNPNSKLAEGPQVGAAKSPLPRRRPVTASSQRDAIARWPSIFGGEQAAAGVDFSVPPLGHAQERAPPGGPQVDLVHQHAHELEPAAALR